MRYPKLLCIFQDRGVSHCPRGAKFAVHMWRPRGSQVSRAKSTLINIWGAPLVWIFPLPCFDQTTPSDERPQ